MARVARIPIGLKIIGVIILAAVATWHAIGWQVQRRAAAAGLEIVSLTVVNENGWKLRARCTPVRKFGAAHAAVPMRFDSVRVDGRFFPVLGHAEATIDGIQMTVPSLRPGAAVASLFEQSPFTAFECRRVIIHGGKVVAPGPPKMVLDIREGEWDRSAGRVRIRFSALDGRRTSLDFQASQDGNSGKISSGIEWSLSGLDLTRLLAQAGISWASQAELGYLEAHTTGTARQEEGSVRVSSLVLIGQRLPKPFRLSVPKVEANISLRPGMLTFQDLQIDRPVFDLMGASEDMIRGMMSFTPVRAWRPKPKGAHSDIPARHSRTSVSSAPENLRVTVVRMRIDTGSVLLIDRPEQTRFVMRATDIRAEMSGPAEYLGSRSNTTAHFRLNDGRAMSWKAVTDFSAWPPRFRLTDVR